jgi:protein involved in polysaccharide export with SLBB domain
VNNFKVFVQIPGATKSGAITLRRNTTLLQLLARLGPLQNADINSSFILRNGKKLSVDFYKLIITGDISQDIPIETNDVIFIPGR